MYQTVIIWNMAIEKHIPLPLQQVYVMHWTSETLLYKSAHIIYPDTGMYPKH